MVVGRGQFLSTPTIRSQSEYAKFYDTISGRLGRAGWFSFATESQPKPRPSLYPLRSVDLFVFACPCSQDNS